MNKLEFYLKARSKLITFIFRMLVSKKFIRIGRNFKLYAPPNFFGNGIMVGDNCWFETVNNYNQATYQPNFKVGNGVAFSDGVHISCAHYIEIQNQVLFGSNIYVGDHSHGYGPNPENIGPAKQPLINFGEIIIGDRCWIGDGSVILANCKIAPDSVIAANSVLKNIYTEKPAIIAGNPAIIVKFLDQL